MLSFIILVLDSFINAESPLHKEFYDRCCPSYKKVIDELDEKLACMKDRKEVRDAIMAFSRRYLTPKEYWNRCFEHDGQLDENDPDCEIWGKLCRKTAKHAFFHLHFEKKKWSFFSLTRNNLPPIHFYFNLYYDKHVKLIDYQHCSASERNIGYPHDNLEECFRHYEEVASSIPSKKVIKRYEEMKDLYLKIKAAEDNVHEWFKLLLEVKDVDFVKDNVEVRLGKDYFDVQLWKLYIGFLKQNAEYKRLIHTYSKYCRFFLDDHDMLEKYKNDMIEYGPINLPWHNCYEFEVQNGVEEAAEEISVEPEAVLPFDSSICSRFYDTYFFQSFSLPGPIILYMLKNANDRVLRQLFSSCKYFFVKNPTPICYRLETGSETRFNNEMLTLVDSANPNFYLKSTYITGCIRIFVSNTSFLSSLIPRLYSCKAKYIKIRYQQLSFDELKFLIQHGGVIDLFANDCEIKDANGDYIDLEKIMAFLPNIQFFYMKCIKVNANTGHALSNMKFNAKLSSCTIVGIRGQPFDSNEFLKYCITNKAERLYMNFCFDEEFDADFVKNFGEILSDYKKSNENVSFYLKHGNE
uniref:Uncharacterized protein n=1 Tax=Panagrolaimus davidi TaxID=227884 RepID=A0A914PSB8_9BILA